MKKIISAILIVSLILSLCACGNKSVETEDAATEAQSEAQSETQTETEVLGRVTAVDGNSITYQTFSQQGMTDGETEAMGTQPDMPEGNATENASDGTEQETPPEKPEDNASENETSGSGQETPPEKPEDNASGNESNGSGQETPPEKPEDNASGNETSGSGQETPPEKPVDSASGNETSGSGQETPPEKPEDNASGNETSGSGQETPPEKPEDNASGNESNGSGQETPPEKPEDSASGNESSGSGQDTPPDMPEGDASEQGAAPEMPSGSSEVAMGETKTITISDTSVLYKYENDSEVQASLSDITVGSLLKITYCGETVKKIIIGSEGDFGMGMGQEGGEGGQLGGQGGGQGAPGSGSSDVIYGGSVEITSAATESDKTYQSQTADQSALLISTSDEVTINNPTVTKSGDSDGGDNCNFYGQNAAVLVKEGSTTTISGGTVSTSATGANGVFSYGGNGGQNGAAGDGTTVIISDTEITTTGSGSGGIMTTGGGTTKASNLTVTTGGQSSAAIRTDRGGGTVVVDGGTYTTNGLGSPAVYSTAAITVSNAKLVSNLSEGVCIEGLNSIELNNTDLTANNTKCNGNATFYDSIMIYQSMSGDAASGTSSFTMNSGTLTSKNGHVFHITNTSAVVTLKGVTIVNEDADNVLLSVCDDGWSGGNNVATLNASNQTLEGAILVGDNSTLSLSLAEGSAFTGYIGGKITNASGSAVSTESGSVSVTLDGTSTWTLTGDSYITSFSGAASNINSNGYTVYVNGVALEGTK